tara:strand:- start:374 stop:1069 length:696 start_codon:yes stop_codon:yes gene_type:complete
MLNQKDKLKSHFKSNGYVVIENAITKEQCNEVMSNVKDLVKNNELNMVSFGDSNFKTINGEKLLKLIPETEILYDKFMLLASDISGEKLVKINNSKIGISLNLTTEGDSFQFHYDRNLITVVAYINEVKGGQMLLSPRARLFSNNNPQRKIYSKFISLLEIIKTKLAESSLIKKVGINPNPGKAIIFEGRETLHKVEKVEKGYDRISIQFAYDLDANLFSPASTKDYYGNN